MVAFGSYGSGGQAQQSPTVYGYAFFNKESIIDKTMMSFSMWKTTLKIGIYPLIETDDDQIKYDRKNGASIFLTPQKAKMFASVLQYFKDNYTDNLTACDNQGIAAGQSLISICSPEFMGKDAKTAGPAIVIRRVSKEGQVESSYAYECKQNFYNTINGFDEKTGKFDQDFSKFNMLEIDMIMTQLNEYCRAMSNTVAFTVADALYPSLDKIAAKLGVDLNSNHNGGTYKNNSYFSGGNQSSGGASAPTGNTAVGAGTLEDLMNGGQH